MAGQTFVGPLEDLKIKIDNNLYLNKAMNTGYDGLEWIKYSICQLLTWHIIIGQCSNVKLKHFHIFANNMCCGSCLLISQ